MYRNVIYNINKDAGWKGEILLSTWDDKGNRIEQVISHNSYLYYLDSKSDDTHKSIFGDNVKIKYFNSVIDRKKWIRKNPDVKIFECNNPKLEFLQNYYYGKNTNLNEFNKYPLRVCFCDIEVAIADGQFVYSDSHIVKIRKKQ